MLATGLSERVAVITGAQNPFGIGAATAKALAAEGARVLIHYVRFPNREHETESKATHLTQKFGEAFYRFQQGKEPTEILQALHSMASKAEAFEADLSDPKAIPRLFARAEETLGPVDILVNNAAHWEADTFLPATVGLSNEYLQLWTTRAQGISAGSIDRLFSINTRAVALMMKEFARRHVERGATWGRVINVSTDGAYCFPSEVSYGASKLALEAYTRSAAHELGHFGITVNAVSPGPVQTGWITPELEEAILPSIPLGRLGAPEDIADVIVFLASDQARWVTGQRLHVGGGHAM